MHKGKVEDTTSLPGAAVVMKVNLILVLLTTRQNDPQMTKKSATPILNDQSRPKAARKYPKLFKNKAFFQREGSDISYFSFKPYGQNWKGRVKHVWISS